MKDFEGYDSNIFSCSQEGETAIIYLKKEAFRMSINASYLQDMLECINKIERDETIKGLLMINLEDFNGIENFENFIQAIKNESGYVKKEMAVARFGNTIKRLTMSINEFIKPTVVCVQGDVAVGHFGFFMAFDYRIASDNMQIEFPALKMGITPTGATSFYFARQLGPTLAAELLLSGKTISAEDAYAYGIVSKLVPKAELKVAALKKLEELYEIPALGYSMTKQMVNPQKHELENYFERSTRAMWSTIIDK
jgi:enoyl-CoA hydratase/carnithine racemase